MRVETPQILWNSEGDKRVNAALCSVSMLESGFARGEFDSYGNVLVTAGSTTAINLWRIFFKNDAFEDKEPIYQKNRTYAKIEYLTSLTRHERSVNKAVFSPDGLHLATAGDAGSIIVWSVPPSKRGNRNGKHYWSTITGEKDLAVRIVSMHCQGICDISWSADSKRFAVGTIDHCVLICEDENFDTNRSHPDNQQVDSSWKVVFRNSSDHTQYVQGVSYDPLGVYVASMGSDRTVRVFSRKTPLKSKRKVLRPANAKGPVPPPEHQRMVDGLLTDSKLDFAKSKLLKYRRITLDETGAQQKRNLYADESTLESFFRRLSWTADGAFLVTPSCVWHADTNSDAPPSFATCLFARHRFDEPCKVLYGLEKPSVVIRPNPVLFKLPANDEDASKENQSPAGSSSGLPYRSVFAVLTLDSVLVYDTYHHRPLSIVSGLHYAGLTDCCWSGDGMNLVVCSSDGYVSIVSFAPGELGEIYETPMPRRSIEAPKISSPLRPLEMPIPPCEPGQTATLEARPAKRAKKTRITPELISAPATEQDKSKTPKRPAASLDADAETECVGEAVTKLTLDPSPKKKKRVQPVLLKAGI